MTRTVLSAFALGAGLLLGVAASSAPAAAQAVLAFVNGDPVTAHDVSQRMKIMQALARSNLSQKQALEQLIDDKLKIIEARRIGYRLRDENIDDRMASIASQNGLTMADFASNLAKAGIDINAYKLKMRADYSWELALSQKGKSEAASGAAANEVREAYEAKLREGAAKVTDFVVTQVIFVVPRTGEGVGQRERDAQAARGRFTSCETDLDELRKLRDVAIRTPVKRSSDQVPGPFAKILNDTPTGRLTPPMRTPQGIEMYAVCEKIEREDKSSVRTRAESEVNSKRNSQRAEEYLKSLRRTAVIQYR